MPISRLPEENARTYSLGVVFRTDTSVHTRQRCLSCNLARPCAGQAGTDYEHVRAKRRGLRAYASRAGMRQASVWQAATSQPSGHETSTYPPCGGRKPAACSSQTPGHNATRTSHALRQQFFVEFGSVTIQMILFRKELRAHEIDHEQDSTTRARNDHGHIRSSSRPKKHALHALDNQGRK